METFSAKRLLLPCHAGDSRFFACDDTLNLYRGCNHGCIYCDTRSLCYHIDRFDEIRVKENCIAILERELRAKRRPGVVAMGAASDPYNEMEREAKITRSALALFARYGFGAGLTTKGDLVTRDIDLLQKISLAAPAYVTFSITCADDELSRLVEPGAPSSSRRFKAMRALSDAGVCTGLWLNPVIPFITDFPQKLLSLVEKAHDCGARYTVCHFGMTLREGNREYFYRALSQIPRLAPFRQQYADAFGLDYQCPSPQAQTLSRLFEDTCQRLSLPFRFSDLNVVLRSREPKQTSLWEAFPG